MNEKESGKGIVQILTNLDMYFSAVTMFIMIVVTFTGVIFRYIFSQPFTWLEEVQKICLIWIVFLTGGVAFRKGAHIAVELLVDSMPRKARAAVEWFIRVVVVVILCYLLIQCVGYVKLFMDNGRLTPVLRIPQWLIYLVAPIGCVDMLISFISHEIKALKEERKNEKGQEVQV